MVNGRYIAQVTPKKSCFFCYTNNIYRIKVSKNLLFDFEKQITVAHLAGALARRADARIVSSVSRPPFRQFPGLLPSHESLPNASAFQLGAVARRAAARHRFRSQGAV